MLDTLGIFQLDVSIGLNEQMDKEKRHGVAHVQRPGGGTIQIPFMVDKPSRLVSPSNLILDSMFAQIKKMGFYPTHLEIIAGSRRTIYEPGKYKPTFSHSL